MYTKVRRIFELLLIITLIQNILSVLYVILINLLFILIFFPFESYRKPCLRKHRCPEAEPPRRMRQEFYKKCGFSLLEQTGDDGEIAFGIKTDFFKD